MRQNYYFFADLIGDERIIASSEGKLQWFRIEELRETPPEMPFTAQHVVKHYIEVGKDTDALYAGVATESGVTFTEMQEF